METSSSKPMGITSRDYGFVQLVAVRTRIKLNKCFWIGHKMENHIFEESTL